MKINHNAVMEKLEIIQKRQKNEAESEVPETTYDEHDPKTSKSQFNLILERAKTLKQCLDACPEFEHDVERQTLYCSICWPKEKYEGLENRIQLAGIFTFTGDYEENFEKVPRDLSNIKIKMKRNPGTQTHKSKVILVENQEHFAMRSQDARIEWVDSSKYLV